jgi:hypothetical protein
MLKNFNHFNKEANFFEQFLNLSMKEGLINSVVYDIFIDITLDSNIVEGLNEVEKEFIKKYAFLDAQLNKYILSADNDRFTNHSDNPNTNPNIVGEVVANRNIKKGEEITANYFEIDKFADEKFS